MRGLVPLACGAFLLSACDRTRAPSPPDVKIAAPDEAAVRAYRDKVAAYLDEARSTAKLFKFSPAPDEVRRRADRLTELLAQIPPAPAGVDAGGETAKLLHRIREVFETARIEATGANLKDAGVARRIYQDRLPALATRAEELATEAEARVRPK